MSEQTKGIQIDELLRKSVESGASDLHLKVGSTPTMRIDGRLSPMTTEPRLSKDDVLKVALTVMNPSQKDTFKKNRDIDFAYSVSGLGRFRCNAFMQRGTISIVFRVIPIKIPQIDELELPEILKKIALSERGLILVTGTTGSGKSTTLASMINVINENKTVNIITIEDPIEFLHRDKKSLVNQREIGTDAGGFSRALRASLRQDPDVILVGEMRDLETIETAVTAAETGHLVLSTLHTVDAAETVNRIISVFPPHQQRQIRLQLSSVIKGIISLRLLPRADGTGRVPAVEVLIATLTVRECIFDPEKTKILPDVIAQGKVHYGMQTFDQSILDLLSRGRISHDEAIKNATNPDDLALKIKGISSTAESSEEVQAKLMEQETGSGENPFGGPDDTIIDRFSQ